MDNEEKLSTAFGYTGEPLELVVSPGLGQVEGADPEGMRREFSVWSLGSLLVCLMATWEALSSVVSQALINGGPPCLFYNYIISFLGTMALACSMAEIASIYPTAGGQYHWVACLAPKTTRAVASWFTGWISIGGQLVLTASAAFSAGLQLQALITLNNPNYDSQRWQGMMFYWLVLAYALVINVWGSRLLPHVNMVSGILHIAGFVVIVVVLGAMTKDKHSADYVFTDFSNTSGWDSDGISWLVGLLSTVYPFLGYDAAAHMAEELPNPSRYVPIAMVGSIVINGFIGFVYCVVLLFCLGDLTELLDTSTGFPFMQLFLNVTGSPAGASVMSLIVSLIAVAATAAGMTSTSRTAWAFARDGALPYSEYFSKVHPRRQIPVRVCVLLTLLAALLGPIYVGNVTAFDAILSMAVLGMYASYVIPIAYMLLGGRKSSSGRHPRFGPFKLGAWGVPLNVIAIFWGSLAMLFSMFPSYQPVNPQNMNYAAVVMGGWVAAGAVYYLLFLRHSYHGPIDVQHTFEADS